MADITTVAGLRVLFDPAAIAAVADSNGQAVIYGLRSVSVARQPAPLEYGAEVHSVIFAGGLEQAVRETLDVVKQAINRAGGNL